MVDSFLWILIAQDLSPSRSIPMEWSEVSGSVPAKVSFSLATFKLAYTSKAWQGDQLCPALTASKHQMNHKTPSYLSKVFIDPNVDSLTHTSWEATFRSPNKILQKTIFGEITTFLKAKKLWKEEDSNNKRQAYTTKNCYKAYKSNDIVEARAYQSYIFSNCFNFQVGFISYLPYVYPITGSMDYSCLTDAIISKLRLKEILLKQKNSGMPR